MVLSHLCPLPASALLFFVMSNSKFTFRGVDLDQLLDMKSDELVTLFHARARRR
jgi:hypothetical protein